MKKYDFKKSYNSVCGQQHILSGVPCQDSVKIEKKNELLVVALSDGAGSCKNSEIASAHITNWAMDYFSENFELFWERRFNIKTISQYISSAARESFLSCSIPIRQCCCTFLAMIIHEDGRWMAVHIGDGCIIINENDSAKILSHPENGEFANITFFINEDDSANHLRTYFGEMDVDRGGFMLTSDGCSEALIDTDKNLPAKAVDILFQWLFENDEESVTEAINTAMRDSFSLRSEDDLSIAIVNVQKLGES